MVIYKPFNIDNIKCISLKNKCEIVNNYFKTFSISLFGKIISNMNITDGKINRAFKDYLSNKIYQKNTKIPWTYLEYKEYACFHSEETDKVNEGLLQPPLCFRRMTVVS